MEINWGFRMRLSYWRSVYIQDKDKFNTVLNCVNCHYYKPGNISKEEASDPMAHPREILSDARHTKRRAHKSLQVRVRHRAHNGPSGKLAIWIPTRTL